MKCSVCHYTLSPYFDMTLNSQTWAAKSWPLERVENGWTHDACVQGHHDADIAGVQRDLVEVVNALR